MPHVLLPVVSIVELRSTLLTMDILVHVKQLSITRLLHRDITGKVTSTSQRISGAICLALSSEATFPHKMAAHGKKEATGGVGMATKPGESRYAAVAKMATTRGTTAAHVHIVLTFKTRV